VIAPTIAGDVRPDHKSQNRQGARPHHPAAAGVARGSGHRM